MVFLSGLYWTLHKDMAGPDRPHVLVDQEADFNRRGRASAISDAQGQAVISGKPDQGIGQAATICPFCWRAGNCSTTGACPLRLEIKA